MLELAKIRESFTAEKNPPIYPDIAPNTPAMVNQGTYFHAI